MVRGSHDVILLIRVMRHFERPNHNAHAHLTLLPPPMPLMISSHDSVDALATIAPTSPIG